MQQSTIEPLCEYCTKIPFSPHTLKRGGAKSWNLGSGFRLVALSILEHGRYKADPPIPLAEMQRVFITWDEFGGQASRGAFVIWSPSEQDDAHPAICFGEDSSLDIKSADCYLKSSLEPEIDIEAISSWLAQCSINHGERCVVLAPAVNSEAKDNLPLVKEAIPGLDYLHLIDVQENSLKKEVLMPRYVALSYIWGGTANFRLTKGNEAALSQYGILKPENSSGSYKLPRLRYLWVDTLCLVQNDPRELEVGVDVMDRIYECFWLTIAAASGHNANAGLPGVRQDSRRKRSLCREVLPGVRLGLEYSLNELLMHSVYSTRAWT
ncbi:hypothetical protein B0T14DRAFT_535348 [Immersiella caudata]|uniref:Heterokaryon incompatibility domain-containing protein n=1 Tax=Immersiella caudata TaxID=314043 RepID=A0AA39X5C4_9PEZI|nr:hypothetical protein B0T14DRAFT_535348 [Immersiella caudata]